MRLFKLSFHKQKLWLIIAIIITVPPLVGHASFIAHSDSITPSILPQQIDFLIQEGNINEDDIEPFLDSQVIQNNQKFNIWLITAQQLTLQLGVTPFQAQAFINFRKTVTPETFTLARLKEIPAWDRKTITRAEPYLYYDPPFTVQRSKLKAEANITTSYIQNKVASTQVYPYSLLILGRASTNSFQIGILAHKGVYEPIFNSQTIPSFDRYGFFIEAKNSLPYVKQVIMGDYKLSLASGLIIRQSFMHGVYASTLQPPSSSLRATLSSSGANNSRGVAFLAENKKWQALVAYSKKPIDTHFFVNEDEYEVITSLQYDPPHRTEKELQRRNNATEQFLATRLAYQTPSYTLGVNGIMVNWPHRLRQIEAPTTQTEPTYITSAHNFSFDVQYHHPSGFFDAQAEVATDRNNHWGATSTFQYRSLTYGTLLTIARVFSPNFFAPLANTFQRGTLPTNEWGISFRYDSPLWHNISISTFSDFFQSVTKNKAPGTPTSNNTPWGIDANLQAKYTSPIHPLQINLTTSLKTTRKGYSPTKSKYNTRYQISALWHPTQWIQVTPTLQYKSFLPLKNENAILLALNTKLKLTQHISGSVVASYFNTTSFYTRVYVYIPRISYSATLPLFYGKGNAFVAMLSYKTGHWQIATAFAYTHATVPPSINNKQAQLKQQMQVSFSIAYHFK